MKCKAYNAFVTQYEEENEEMEKQIDKLEEENESMKAELSKLWVTIKQLTQLDKVIKLDADIMEDFEPSQVKAFINLLTVVQKQVIEDSLTIRVVEWIAHRDWAVRSLWIVKSHLLKLLKSIKKNWWQTWGE